MNVDRRQVLAYRVAAQQLDRTALPPSELAVLDLGVQDTPYGSARQAVSARTSADPEDSALTLVWSTRGAPHLHRTSDLPALAAALWPVSDADATARIATAQIKEGAKLGLAAFRSAAKAMHDVVIQPMSKGEVSKAVSAQIPECLTYWCRGCSAQHISGALFQQVGLAAGVRLTPQGSATTLAPATHRPAVPTRSVAPESVVRAYLTLLGPATPAEAAKFLGTTLTEVKRMWPKDLAEIRIDGRKAWLPAERVPALREAPSPRLLRLLPPSDPYLQARDRTLLVPEKARQSEIWRILGNPGAVLLNGEIAGTWRAKMAGKNVLDLTVTAFEPLPRPALEAEADRVGRVRGARATRVLEAT
ncbi:winged helix DNA-binding domain-containing protein [Acrocarpospora catenulata]|uniref:winged helix DNA-binding domain-containing protein n=1 Tax=Acrocarpospora catenulata TaxID=2836182 RepID=UPI001BDA03DF|nr:winged helix DNA-binding domain-containing protein [Acrocarpospora catenulata]